MAVYRIRVGVVKADDGWWVITQAGGVRRFFGRPSGGGFDTEQEAEDKANDLARNIRRSLADAGMVMDSREEGEQ